MAKKIVTTREIVDDQDRIGNPPADDELMDDGGEGIVSRIMDSMGPGEIKIKVFKLGTGGQSYCYSTDGQVDEDFIQEHFGGGRYEGKIFVNGSYRRSFAFSIADRLKLNGGMASGSNDPMIQLLREQLSELRNEIRANSQQKQTPISELASALEKLHTISGGNNNGGDKAMEYFIRGVELARGGGLGSAKEGGDDWMGIIKDALPVVGEFMKARGGNMSPNPGGGNVPQTTEKALSPGAADGLIRDGLAFLKTQAIRGRDPLLFVDLTLANADDAQYQPILQFALNADIAALAAYDADIGKPPPLRLVPSVPGRT